VPILTGFAADPRQQGYHLLEVDRRRFASLPDDALAGLPLVLGRAIDERTLNRLTRLADVEAALRAGARALARRGFARQDLRRRLVQRQHPAQSVEAALDRLAAAGLMDDERYSRQYAASRAARGRGPARLLRDLLAQGVERGTAEQAIAAALDEEGVDPLEAARSVARQRAAVMRTLPLDVRRRRLTAFLLRRGFGGAHLASVVREAVAT
jgi:regulatory protein